MKFLPLLHSLLLVEFFILPFTTFTTPFSDYDYSFSDYEEDSDEPRATTLCKFERTKEVYRECSQVLSLASKEKLNNNNFYGANYISFQNGDWVQPPGGAPLMPFDDTDMPKNSSINNQSLLKLASFWLTGVDFTHQTESSIRVCGLLYIGITRNRTLPYTPDEWKPWFYHRPGYSNLIIPFEGLYAESEENGGERLMCLLGRSYSPFAEVFASPNPWEELLDNRCKRKQEYPFVEDDRIMLVLRYPQRFTLTSRAILGEMRSLNQKKNPRYFDPVKIFSRLSYESKYFFGSKELLSRACEPYPYEDKLIGDRGIQVFQGLQYCKVFKGFGSEVFDLLMVSKCDGTAKHCNKLGPFILEKTGKSLNDLRLTMTDLRCVSGDHPNKDKTAKVSAVFRAISSGEDRFSLGARTGLSGMTISAEGIWNSSTGQLCMVGCVGLETDLDGCNTRICLYLPLQFTVTQRSIVIGTISSVENADSQSPPLLFKKELLPLDLWNRYSEYSNSLLSYKYSKVELASELLKRNGFSQLGRLIKTLLFFTYPTVQDPRNFTSLSALSDQLSLDVIAFPDCLLNSRAHKVYLKFEVLSLGRLFGRYFSFMKHSCKGEDAEFHVNSDSRDQKLPLNISGHLTLRSSSYSTSISKLFLEGIYDPLGGKMYLIGCRDVLNTQKFMYDDMKLENEMDCLVQVRIEYSSKTTRWLVNPTAKIFIGSQRTEEDPLNFSPIRLCTSLVLYGENSEEIAFRKNFEALLRILMLLASIACLLSQWLYIKKKDEFTTFMSLTMLGVQAFGFALPLVADTAILFKWKEYKYPESRSLWNWKSLHSQMLDCVMKFLLLSAFVLTLRLFHKVWESRELTGKPRASKQNVGDKRVFLSTLIIHMVGFLVVLITHSKKTTTEIAYWVTALEEYVGLVQDFFLIPQMIGNSIWQIQVRPLSAVYFIGFTVLKLVLHGYDYLRDPVFSPYYHKYESNASSQFFSKSEQLMIMTIVAVLAIVVYAQQKYWRFNKLV